MKKRIISLLLISAMAFSAFVFSGCDSLNNLDSLKSAKQLFYESLGVSQKDDTASGAYSIKGNMLMREDDESKYGFDLKTDSASGIYNGRLVTELNGESLTADISGNNEKRFYYIEGLTDKHIFEGIAEDIDTDSQYTTDEDKIINALSELINKYCEIIKTDKLDSLYTKKTEDITACGESFAESEVLQLELTDEQVRELYGSDEIIDKYDISLNVRLGRKDGTLSAAVINGTAKFDIDEKETTVTLSLENTADKTDFSAEVTSGGEKLAAASLNRATADGKAEINGSAIFYSSYADEDMSFNSETEISVQYNETEAGKAGNGSINIIMKDEYPDEVDSDYETSISIDIAYSKSDDGTHTVVLDNVAIEDSISFSFDIALTIAVTPTETGYTVKAEMADSEFLGWGFSLEAQITEAEAFEYTLPEDYISASELGEDFYGSFEEQYPNIYNNYMFGDIEDGEEEDGEEIFISSGASYYYIRPEAGEGEVTHNFYVEYENGKAEVTLWDGTDRSFMVSYGDIAFDEDLQCNTIMLGGSDLGDVKFTIEELEVAEDEYGETTYFLYCESLTDSIDIPSYVYIYYYPESEYGMLQIPFTVNADGDEYTFNYPDGTTATKTVLYNEELMQYYFEGQEIEQTKTIEVSDENGEYIFMEEPGIGTYTAYFSLDSYGSGSAQILFESGVSAFISYGEPELGESALEGYIELNGLRYYMNIYEENEYLHEYYAFSFEPEDSEKYVYIQYTPATNEGLIYTTFGYQVDGNQYKMTYPDGTTGVKTILYNEEADEYYFPEESKGFSINDETGTYYFGAYDGTGEYFSEFTAVTEGERVSSVTLMDGRVIELDYTEAVFDEEEQIYITELNGRDYWFSEYIDESDNTCYSLQCIEPIAEFQGKVIDTINITYYPEKLIGRINIAFLYEESEGEYTLRLADGHTVTKTILYDEDEDLYYFGE